MEFKNKRRATQIEKRWVFLWTVIFLAALTFSSALVEISFTLALGGWFLLKIKDPEASGMRGKIGVALLGFVLICVASFFWSEYPRQSLRGIFKVLKQALVFWIAADTLADAKRLSWTNRVLVVLFLILGIDGAFQYVFGKDLIRHIPFEPASSGPRISASFKNYGLLASFVVTFLPLLFSPFQKDENKGLFFGRIAAILLGTLLLYWTRMRGAWLAFALGVAFYLFWMKRKHFFFLFLLLGATGLFLLPRHMKIHLDAEGKEQSIVERFVLWERAVDVIRARRLTGTGINTYTVAHQRYDRKQNWRVRNYYAHNGYLQIAAETGLPSLAFFLAFLFFYFSEALRSLRALEGISRNTLIGIITGILNFLLFGGMDTVFHNPQAVLGFWFLAGWGMAYQRLIRFEARAGGQ